jgi:DNA (cytosine-5)-methyltransferase 1
MYTVGSLFSGIGGLDIGFERAGFEIKWQCEIDPFCQNILRKHWPEIPCHTDIKCATLEPVDVLIGGFPCQDISNAGKTRGIHGEKSQLWFEMLRIIRLLRPRFILVENVSALLNRGFGTILGGLAEIGYDAEWTVLSAATVGAPHLRKRICLVAYSDYKGEPILSIDDEEWSRVQTSNKREAWLLQEPNMGRMDDGIPRRMDRIRGLGNSVVPQWAEFFAARIKKAIDYQ